MSLCAAVFSSLCGTGAGHAPVPAPSPSPTTPTPTPSALPVTATISVMIRNASVTASTTGAGASAAVGVIATTSVAPTSGNPGGVLYSKGAANPLVSSGTFTLNFPSTAEYFIEVYDPDASGTNGVPYVYRIIPYQNITFITNNSQLAADGLSYINTATLYISYDQQTTVISETTAEANKGSKLQIVAHPTSGKLGIIRSSQFSNDDVGSSILPVMES
jgi:hypothetical protein